MKLSCAYTQLREEILRVKNIREAYVNDKKNPPETKVLHYLDLVLQNAQFALGEANYKKMEEAYEALVNIVYE